MNYKIISELPQEDDISSISQNDSENYEDGESVLKIGQCEEQESFEMDFHQMKSKGIKYIPPIPKPTMIVKPIITQQLKSSLKPREKENVLPQNSIKRPSSSNVTQSSVKSILKNKSTNETAQPELTQTLKSEHNSAYKIPYNNFLQKSKQFNYSQKNFNTLVRKSDRVARYLETNQSWKKSQFLKSNSNTGIGSKEGRKLNLEDRIKYQKQCQQEEGIFYKNITRSELFL